MDDATKAAGGRLLVSVLTIITTVLASTFGVDYRISERAETVHAEVTSVASQHDEIMKALEELLDKKLETTSQNSATNVKLNQSILKSTSTNQDLNIEILHRLEALEKQMSSK